MLPLPTQDSAGRVVYCVNEIYCNGLDSIVMCLVSTSIWQCADANMVEMSLQCEKNQKNIACVAIPVKKKVVNRL